MDFNRSTVCGADAKLVQKLAPRSWQVTKRFNEFASLQEARFICETVMQRF